MNKLNLYKTSTTNFKKQGRISICFFLLICLTINFNKSLAVESGYYEVPESGRPISVFSLCCCKKESEDNQQMFYSCKYIDDTKCPEDTKQYNVTFTQCPSSLMYTKYN